MTTFMDKEESGSFRRIKKTIQGEEGLTRRVANLNPKIISKGKIWMKKTWTKIFATIGSKVARRKAKVHIPLI